MDFEFEWDEVKAALNEQKHGVSFEESTTVFVDPMAVTVFDDEHSTIEDRFIDIGRSGYGRILVVVYTERGNRIRIISSRKATATEQRHYERQNTER